MDDRKEASQDGCRDEAAGGKPPPNRLQVQIRWLERRDMPAVLAIESREVAHRWNENKFLSALRQRDCVGFVAEHEDRIIGFMVYDFDKEKVRLLKFVVDPDCRLRGVGRQMIERLAGKLSSRGPSSLELIVNERNLVGQKFFRSCGFKAQGVEKGLFDDTGCDGFRMLLKHVGSDPEDAAWQQKIEREERKSKLRDRP